MTVPSDPALRPPAPERPGPGDPDRSATLARNWWLVLLRGVAAVLLGIVALLSPGTALLSFALLSFALVFGAYLIVDGAFAIVAAIRRAGRHRPWGLLMAEGGLGLLVGALALLFPAGAVLAFVLVLAVWALVTGALLVAAAIALTRAHGRLWMALGGVVSILFGVLLVLAPLVGAVVLTWWVGAYALVFGGLLIALALNLRFGGRGSPGAARASDGIP